MPHNRPDIIKAIALRALRPLFPETRFLDARYTTTRRAMVHRPPLICTALRNYLYIR